MIGRNVVIEDEVVLGKRCTIASGCIIYLGTIVGDDVTIEANSVIGRQPKSGTASTRRTVEMPPLKVGSGVAIGACAVIYAGVSIDENAMIADLASVREGCHICESAIIGRAVTVECNSVIGPRSKIQTACHITGDMTIDEDVFLGPGVVTMNDKYMGKIEAGEYKGPHVMRGATVGSNSTILPGVTIGEDAVVGAGAVVTRNVPHSQTHVGVPARAIRGD